MADKQCPDKMADLPPEVREFLAGLRPNEVTTLKHGIRLVTALMTVGRATRWLIITVLGIATGMVMFGETIGRMWGWFQRPP